MEHLVHAPGARKWTETDHSWHLHLNTWGAGWEVLCWNNRVLSRSEATDVARHSALGERATVGLTLHSGHQNGAVRLEITQGGFHVSVHGSAVGSPFCIVVQENPLTHRQGFILALGDFV